MALLHKNSLVLVLSVIGPGLIVGITSLFYIKVFFEEYHLPVGYAKVVQILFLVWNAINDPIIGYMQDIGCGMRWIMDRRKVILYAGPVLAASFLLFWFPWSTNNGLLTALNLLVSLFLYDTLMTLVFSAFCGLCVESSIMHEDRVRITVYSEIFGILGGCLIFPLELLPHTQDDFWVFQLFCVLIAVFAAFLTVVAGRNLKIDRPTHESYGMKADREEEGTETETKGIRKAMTVSWQILKEPRFVCLFGAQFFRILRFMANENFLITFIEALLLESGFFEKNSSLLGFYYVLVRSCGSVLFLCMWTATIRFGAQAVIQSLNLIAMLNVVAAVAFGPNCAPYIFVFFIIENAVTRCGWQGFYMVVAGEVIDKDMRQHRRKNPLSTMIFTLKALLTKPADQLAPVLILIAFLERGGYPRLSVPCRDFALHVAFNATSTEFPMVASADCMDYRWWLFVAATAFPAVCIVGESVFVAADQFFRQRINATDD